MSANLKVKGGRETPRDSHAQVQRRGAKDAEVERRGLMTSVAAWGRRVGERVRGDEHKGGGGRAPDAGVWVRQGCNHFWNSRGSVCAEPPGDVYGEASDKDIRVPHRLSYGGQRCRSDVGEYEDGVHLNRRRVGFAKQLGHCGYGGGRVRSRDLEGSHRAGRSVTLAMEKATDDGVRAQGGWQLGFQTLLRGRVGLESLQEQGQGVGRDGQDGFACQRVVGPLRDSLNPLLECAPLVLGFLAGVQHHRYSNCQEQGSSENECQSLRHALSVVVRL
jgi:hypothetical protein